MEGNASVYQVNPVSRITGEGKAEFSRTWRPGFEQERAGGGETGGVAQSVCGNYKSYPVSRTTSEEKAERSRGWGGGGGGRGRKGFSTTSLGRIDTGVCYMRVFYKRTVLFCFVVCNLLVAYGPSSCTFILLCVGGSFHMV